jgi:hypothetical protein
MSELVDRACLPGQSSLRRWHGGLLRGFAFSPFLLGQTDGAYGRRG